MSVVTINKLTVSNLEHSNERNINVLSGVIKYDTFHLNVYTIYTATLFFHEDNLKPINISTSIECYIQYYNQFKSR